MKAGVKAGEVALGARIPKELKVRMNRFCLEHGLKMSHFVKRALQDKKVLKFVPKWSPDDFQSGSQKPCNLTASESEGFVHSEIQFHQSLLSAQQDH